VRVAAKGLTYRGFQEMERGRKKPTVRTLFTLARMLGITVSMLTQTEQEAGAKRPLALADIAASPPRRGRKPHGPKRKPSSAGQNTCCLRIHDTSRSTIFVMPRRKKQGSLGDQVLHA
jgi:transcriptional regulator with XRE-family HTH domain